MALLTQHKIKPSVVGGGTSGALLSAVEWDKFSGGDLTHTITKLRRTGQRFLIVDRHGVDNVIELGAQQVIEADLGGGNNADASFFCHGTGQAGKADAYAHAALDNGDIGGEVTDVEFWKFHIFPPAKF